MSTRPKPGNRLRTAATSGYKAENYHNDLVDEDAHPIVADSRAKLFQNGRSQAVRLPKAFRMPGDEVLIRRDGDRIILEPIPSAPVDRYGWPRGFWGEMRDLTADLDFPDPEPLGATLLSPDELLPPDSRQPPENARQPPAKKARR